MKTGRNGSEPHASEAQLAHQEILDYERNVNNALARLHRPEPLAFSTRHTALDEIFADEESPRCPRCNAVIEQSNALEQWNIRCETVRRLESYISQDGRDPVNVMRNLFAAFHRMGVPGWADVTVRQTARWLGVSTGTIHIDRKKAENLLRWHGSTSMTRGEKQIESRGSYSECQQGNRNRRRQHRCRHRNVKRKLKKQHL